MDITITIEKDICWVSSKTMNCSFPVSEDKLAEEVNEFLSLKGL